MLWLIFYIWLHHLTRFHFSIIHGVDAFEASRPPLSLFGIVGRRHIMSAIHQRNFSTVRNEHIQTLFSDCGIFHGITYIALKRSLWQKTKTKTKHTGDDSSPTPIYSWIIRAFHVTSHKRHGVSNHRRLNCLFYSFQYRKIKMALWPGNTCHLTGPLCGEFTDQYPLTRGQ